MNYKNNYDVFYRTCLKFTLFFETQQQNWVYLNLLVMIHISKYHNFFLFWHYGKYLSLVLVYGKLLSLVFKAALSYIIQTYYCFFVGSEQTTSFKPYVKWASLGGKQTNVQAKITKIILRHNQQEGHLG